MTITLELQPVCVHVDSHHLCTVANLCHAAYLKAKFHVQSAGRVGMLAALSAHDLISLMLSAAGMPQMCYSSSCHTGPL